MVNLLPMRNNEGEIVFVNQMETPEGRATHLAMKAPVSALQDSTGKKAKAITKNAAKDNLDSSKL